LPAEACPGCTLTPRRRGPGVHALTIEQFQARAPSIRPPPCTPSSLNEGGGLGRRVHWVLLGRLSAGVPVALLGSDLRRRLQRARMHPATEVRRHPPKTSDGLCEGRRPTALPLDPPPAGREEGWGGGCSGRRWHGRPPAFRRRLSVADVRRLLGRAQRRLAAEVRPRSPRSWTG